MGKVKSRKAVIEIDNSHFQFRSLPSRSVVSIKQEILEGKVETHPDPEKVPKGCLVRIEQRYPVGEEEVANRSLDSLIKILKPRAHFIRPADRIVIREQNKRMELMKHDLAPMKAVELWLKEKPPKKINKALILSNVLRFLDELGSKDFERILPDRYFISGLMVCDWMPFGGSWIAENLPKGLIGIVGRYEGQDGRSNRSGKSSLLDAIHYSLFGKGRDVKVLTELIHDKAEKLEVGTAIQFEDGRSVVVQRSFGSQGKIVIDGGTRKVEEAKDEIHRLLGLTEEDFTRTCFVKQGELEDILARQSAELKADIIRWRGLKIWTSLDSLVQAEESLLTKEFELMETRKKIALETVEKGEPSTDEIEHLESAIEEIEIKRSSFAAAKEKVEKIRREISMAQKVEELKKRLGPRAELSKTKKEVEEKLSELKRKLDEAKAIEIKRREEKNKAEDMFKSGFDGRCPIDGSSCPRADEINEGTEESKSRLNKACDCLKGVVQSRQAIEKNVSGFQTLLSSVESKLREISVAEETIEQVGDVKDLAKLQRELSVASESARGGSIDAVALKELKDRLVVLMANKQSYRDARASLRSCEESLNTMKEKLRLYQYLRFMFGKSGIPSMMIENALEEIEGQVNYILEELGADHRLKFDPERTLKRLSRTCFECGAVFEESRKEKFCQECGAARQFEKSDELTPMIVEGGRKHSFKLDSGGGRGLVALATRAAMSRFLGASVLFLDEISSGLDDYHLTLLIRLLHKLPSLGFEQVFVVSHQKEIDAAMPVQIVVNRIQEEGRSTLAF